LPRFLLLLLLAPARHPPPPPPLLDAGGVWSGAGYVWTHETRQKTIAGGHPVRPYFWA